MRFAKLALAATLAAGPLSACHDHKPVVHAMPIVVDGNSGSPNQPYITVTVCEPGNKKNCATIDHVILDTGSVGLRILNDTLAANMPLLSALPTQQVGGQDLAECYVYASGYFYGSVRNADVSLAGEVSKSMPIQIAGDLSNPPADCTKISPGAPKIDSAKSLGANGIIGVMGQLDDCGQACTATSSSMNPRYFTCAGGTCTLAAVPVDEQVPNPIATFDKDNNGYAITLPPIDDVTGAANPMGGTLTFGLGTEKDNALPKDVTVYGLGTTTGLTSLESTVGSTSFSITVLDSGTPLYLVSLPDVTACTGNFQGLYCPSSLETLPVALTGADGSTGSTPMKIANAEELLTSLPQSTTAVTDLAEDAALLGSPQLFIMGLTHFWGRTIYFGISGRPTGTHVGPFYALSN